MAHALHPEDPDIAAHQLGENELLEAAVMRIHDVQRHLHRLDPRFMPLRFPEHVQVDGGILVAREPDMSELSRLARFFQRFLRAALPEDPVRVLVSDDFVMLHEIDAIHSQPRKRFFELLRRGLTRAAVDLRHHERALAVSTAQRLPHALLARAFVVVPRVVHEGDAVVDRRADQTNREFLLDVFRTDMRSAEADARNALAGRAERAKWNSGGAGRAGHSTCPYR